jgi:hypothetical protein
MTISLSQAITCKVISVKTQLSGAFSSVSLLLSNVNEDGRFVKVIVERVRKGSFLLKATFITKQQIYDEVVESFNV